MSERAICLRGRFVLEGESSVYRPICANKCRKIRKFEGTGDDLYRLYQNHEAALNVIRNFVSEDKYENMNGSTQKEKPHYC